MGMSASRKSSLSSVNHSDDDKNSENDDETQVTSALDHANTADMEFDHATSEAMDLDHANRRATDVDRANFIATDVNRANFTEAAVNHANFTATDVNRANFTEAAVNHANFTEAAVNSHVDFGAINYFLNFSSNARPWQSTTSRAEDDDATTGSNVDFGVRSVTTILSTPSFPGAVSGATSGFELKMQVPSAPSAIEETHLRVVKLHILAFEMGPALLEEAMKNWIQRNGFSGWKEWMTKYSGEVKRYQFYRNMVHELFPDPKPSSWDVTFLTFLSRSRVLDFPASKKRAADELRQCRNKLSHEIKTTIGENEFEQLWSRLAMNALIPLSDETRLLEEQIDRVKSLKVDDTWQQPHQQQQLQQPHQQHQQQQRLRAQQNECDCSGERKCVINGGVNNNHEPRQTLGCMLTCWRCGIPRFYALQHFGDSDSQLGQTTSSETASELD